MIRSLHARQEGQDRLVAAPLGRPDLGQAYPLVELWHDKVSLERWQEHVARYDGGGRGNWHAVRDDRDYIHALFRHEVIEDLLCGRTLVLADIMPAGVGWRSSLVAIVEAAEQLAERCDCDGVRLSARLGCTPVDEPCPRFCRLLREAGYRTCGDHMCRRRKPCAI